VGASSPRHWYEKLKGGGGEKKKVDQMKEKIVLDWTQREITGLKAQLGGNSQTAMGQLKPQETRRLEKVHGKKKKIWEGKRKKNVMARVHLSAEGCFEGGTKKEVGRKGKDRNGAKKSSDSFSGEKKGG